MLRITKRRRRTCLLQLGAPWPATNNSCGPAQRTRDRRPGTFVL